MKFIDEAKIYVKAGDGGRGCVSFRREKYVPKGGPDGGNAGKGGDGIFIADNRLTSLLDFQYKREFSAERGEHGMGSLCSGKNGEDLVIKLPIGTLIKDQETGEVLSDLTHDGETFICCKGGRGGKGNAHFATSTHQTPRFAQPGEPGTERNLKLELKLLADVGIIGFPNAGKSTLISHISAAKPKVADYPFTTLVPHLGIVKYGDFGGYVVADIPGLIENAHKGAGLGFEFLRHVERTSILLHMVDVSGMVPGNPAENFRSINKELELYSGKLTEKYMAVAATKIDAADPEKLDELEKHCRKEGYAFFPISAVTGAGLETLVNFLAGKVEEGRAVKEGAKEPVKG